MRTLPNPPTPVMDVSEAERYARLVLDISDMNTERMLAHAILALCSEFKLRDAEDKP